MAETLCHTMEAEDSCATSEAQRTPLTWDTACEYNSTVQRCCRAKRSICSTMQSSVPCVRSRNGLTTASRNSALPRNRLNLGGPRCHREHPQAIQNAQQTPEEDVQDKVLIRTADKHHRKPEHDGIEPYDK